MVKQESELSVYEESQGIACPDKLMSLLGGFETITLNEMDKVGLMKRAETKYVLSIGELFRVLPALSEYYKVVVIEGNYKSDYRTIYYDTQDFEMYERHHNGLADRYKIRTREYLNTDTGFTEVKFKDNKKQTIKKRIENDLHDPGSHELSKRFIEERSPFKADDLEQVLENDYSRITLVHKETVERLTIDFDIEYFGPCDKRVKLGNLAVAEIKQERFSQKSDFVRLMHEMLIRPRGFSKYCMGVSFLYDEVKKNNFKKNMRLVDRLAGEVQA